MAFEIEPGVAFDVENVEMPELDQSKIEKWIERICMGYGKELGEIQYIFCDDPKILEVNLEYLQHDYFTDIITFDYCDEDVVSGDLFISLDTVKTNAVQFSQNYIDELLRVIIHGILHLCGLKDKSDEDAKNMREAEESALSIYNTL